MKQAGLRIYAGALLLTLMFFFILLFIDGVSYSLNIFGELSASFSQGMLNLFGKFPLLIISIGIYLGFIIFIVMDSSSKLLSSAGYTLLMLFFPPFFQSVNSSGFGGGYFGRAVSSFFESAGQVVSLFVYFFWFLLATFLLLYPLRETVVRFLLKFIPIVEPIEEESEVKQTTERSDSGGEKKESAGQGGLLAKTRALIMEQVEELSQRSEPREKRKRQEIREPKKKSESGERKRPVPKRERMKGPRGGFSKGVPLLSKVVYESPSNRVEIPIFPSGHSIKKFRLNPKEEPESVEEVESESYEEVDTFSGKSPNLVYEEINRQKANYFDRVKSNWPQNWKDNAGERDLELNSELESRPEPEEIQQDDYRPVDFALEMNKREPDTVEAVDKREDDYILVDEVEVKPISEPSNEESSHDELAIDEFSVAEELQNAGAVQAIEAESTLQEDEFNVKRVENDFEKFDGNYRVELSPDELEALLGANDASDDDYEDIDKEQPFDGYTFNEAMPQGDMFGEPEAVVEQDETIKAEEQEAARILEATLMEFGIKAEVVDTVHGPVVTLFKLTPAPGIRLSKIEGLSNNLALRLGAKSIRIIAPIPGEKVVGIEIPNNKRELVSFSEVVNDEEFTESKFQIPIGLGKDIYGKIIVIDLYKMPHILIAGATGAGKSVCVNGFLSSILFSCSPEDVRLILIDPKIVELKPYNDIPHLFTPVITDSKEAILALKYLVFEMERRYSLLDQMGVRDIVEYNRLQKSKKPHMERLPFVVTVVDEFADLMSTAGKEPEMLFARLTAKARAVGIHLVLATQRPSADVITGLIKANVPARIAFQVISLQDSRIILDQKGAEKLLGQGDMLYLSPTQPFPIRLQGAYLGKEEVDAIAEHWKGISDPDYVDIKELLGENDEDEAGGEGGHSSKDPLFDEAVEIIIQTNKASASYLQRRLNIGYNRAARLVEEMEAGGIVGPANGSKPREVLIDYYQG